MRVKEKKRKAKKQTEKWIELLPLILILAVLPMVVHLKIVSTGLENYPWFPDESSSLGKMLAAPGQELFPYFVSWDSGFAILSGYLCYRSRKMWDIL